MMEKFDNEVTKTLDMVRERIKQLEAQLDAADKTIVQQRREINRLQAVIGLGGRG
jgi:flagellar motility protein MotE (MotC chaperone)